MSVGWSAHVEHVGAGTDLVQLRDDALFASLAHAITARLGDAPLWVSTAGLGVAWLHVRLDSRPKYYRHDAYRRAG